MVAFDQKVLAVGIEVFHLDGDVVFATIEETLSPETEELDRLD